MNILVKRILVLTLTAFFVISTSFEYPAQNNSRSRPRTVSSNAPQGKGQNPSSGDTRNKKQNVSSNRITSQPFTAEDLGLPSNNFVKSPYDEMRIYKERRGGGKKFVKTIPPFYVPNRGEIKQPHGAVDYTSRDSKGNITSLEYKTPMGGIVKVQKNDPYNTVKIKTPYGGEIRFLHYYEV